MKFLFRKAARAISHTLYRHSRLHAFLKHCFLALPAGLRGRQMIWDSLVALGQIGQPVTVLQIGANDGEQSDPVAYFIHKYQWRAILVEPVPAIFEKLKINYAGCENVEFVNAAVSVRDEHQPFYYLEDDKGRLPAWAHGLGSFMEKEVLNHSIPGVNIQECLRKIDVACLTLESLLDRTQPDRLDVLVVDAQGFDHHIIRQIRFDRWRPRIIIYEHILLSVEDRSGCEDLLRRNGYELESDRWDTLATFNSVDANASS